MLCENMGNLQVEKKTPLTSDCIDGNGLFHPLMRQVELYGWPCFQSNGGRSNCDYFLTAVAEYQKLITQNPMIMP